MFLICILITFVLIRPIRYIRDAFSLPPIPLFAQDGVPEHVGPLTFVPLAFNHPGFAAHAQAFHQPRGGHVARIQAGEDAVQLHLL